MENKKEEKITTNGTKTVQKKVVQKTVSSNQEKKVATTASKPTTTVVKKTVISSNSTATKPVATTKPTTTTTTTKPTTVKKNVTTVTKKVVTKPVANAQQTKTTENSVQTKQTLNSNTKKVQTESKSEVEKTQKPNLKISKKIESTKNAIELIGIFQRLEKNLVEVLQTIPSTIEKEGKNTFVENVRAYSKKVKLAREIFDEYENTSKMISAVIESNSNDKESIEMYKKVVDHDEPQKPMKSEKELLREVQIMEKQSKGMQKIEIEAVGDTVVVKKKPVLSRD